MRLVWGLSGDPNGDQIGRWAQGRIPHLFLDHLGPYAAFGIIDHLGDLKGAALYHGHAPQYRGLEISFAMESPRFLSAPIIAGIMSYPFTQLGCARLSAATPRSAASARQFLETFGFKREGLIRSGFGDYGDAVIYGLTRKDWGASRFNRKARLDGQEIRPDAAARA